MKLRKIKDEFYLLSEDTLKERDWALLPDGSTMRMAHSDVLDYLASESAATQKIVASTQQLETLPRLRTLDLIELCVSKEQRLEDLAKEYSKTQITRGKNLPEWDDKVEEIIQRHFTEGFEKCIEVNAEKKFTLKDIQKAIEFGTEMGQTAGFAEGEDSWVEGIESNFINSLQKEKTEWEVEIEMEEYCLLLKSINTSICSKCQTVAPECHRPRIIDGYLNVIQIY